MYYGADSPLLCALCRLSFALGSLRSTVTAKLFVRSVR